MAPKVKFRKEEIIEAALTVARTKGIDAVTAREVAAVLGVSTRPIFTYYDTMDQLRRDVYELAREHYRACVQRGLEAPIPFQGVWRQVLRFAREEPELFRLLFLTRRAEGETGGAMEVLRESQALVRDSVMHVYRLDAYTADCYIRNLWMMTFSFATLMVTDDCPYTEEEILNIGAEVSLALCKAYKEIPGLPRGDYDKDKLFKELVAR